MAFWTLDSKSKPHPVHHLSTRERQYTGFCPRRCTKEAHRAVKVPDIFLGGVQTVTWSAPAIVETRKHLRCQPDSCRLVINPNSCLPQETRCWVTREATRPFIFIVRWVGRVLISLQCFRPSVPIKTKTIGSPCVPLGIRLI